MNLGPQMIVAHIECMAGRQQQLLACVIVVITTSLLLLENHANLLVVFRLVSWCRFLFHVSGGKDLLVRVCVLDKSGCFRVGGGLESPRMCPLEPRLLDTTSLLLLLLLDAIALGGRLITLEPFWLDHG